MKQGHKEVCHLCARPRIMKGIFKSPEEYNEAVRDLENELYYVG